MISKPSSCKYCGGKSYFPPPPRYGRMLHLWCCFSGSFCGALEYLHWRSPARQVSVAPGNRATRFQLLSSVPWGWWLAGTSPPSLLPLSSLSPPSGRVCCTADNILAGRFSEIVLLYDGNLMGYDVGLAILDIMTNRHYGNNADWIYIMLTMLRTQSTKS